MSTSTAAPTRRLAAGLLTGLVAALIAWSPVLGAVTWGTVHRASPDGVYTNGNALGRTVTSSGTPKLHFVYTSYVINGVPTTETGPYLGVYYRRGNAAGDTWSTPRRLNPTTQHGDYASIDTSGKYVYVAWRQQPSDGGAWNGVDPRPLQFRRNTNHGSGDYWKARPSFLGADRIDRPSIAATGSTVWIAYTDAVGGEIRLQKSADNGATFTLRPAVGATTALRDGGYSGRPFVAATGSTVAVVWDNGSETWLKLSTDAGATWSVDQQIAAESFINLDVDATSGRVGIAWMGGSHRDLYVRRWNGSTLGSTKTIVSLSDATTYKQLNSPSISLTGTTTIGVSYTACSDSSCGLSNTMGKSILWIESRDAGKTWVGRKTVGSWTASSSRRENEWSTALWQSSTRRTVVWLAFAANGSSDRMLIRSGSGTP